MRFPFRAEGSSGSEEDEAEVNEQPIIDGVLADLQPHLAHTAEHAQVGHSLSTPGVSTSKKWDIRE